jgi:hypothetical protein
MRFALLICLLLIFFSCEQPERPYPDTIDVEIIEENKKLRKFKMIIDSVLQADYPSDFNFYADHWSGPVQLDTSGKRQKDFGMGYQGEFNYYPLPASGTLYKAELNDFWDSPHPTDPDEAEYIVLFELSPQINGGGFYLFVFGSDDFGNDFITSTYFACQLVDSISFRDMTYDWTQQDEIQIWYDQAPSVYVNKGFVQYRLEEDQLFQVFSMLTFETAYDADAGHEKISCRTNYLNQLRFSDMDQDDLIEIVVDSKTERLCFGDLADSVGIVSSEIIETSQRTYHWSFMMNAYKTLQETELSANL